MNLKIFFDLDGTLTDPKEGITKCIQHALLSLNLQSPDPDDLEWCIGPPLHESFNQLAGKEHTDDAIKAFRVRFDDIGWCENTPYPKIQNVLAELSHTEAKLYVATSKPTVFATRIIDHFGFGDFFDEVFGSELDGTRADKGKLLKHALLSTPAGIPAVMVGDRLHDMIGANSNNIDSIGVTYGYGSRNELTDSGAGSIVDSPEELLSILIKKANQT